MRGLRKIATLVIVTLMLTHSVTAFAAGNTLVDSVAVKHVHNPSSGTNQTSSTGCCTKSYQKANGSVSAVHITNAYDGGWYENGEFRSVPCWDGYCDIHGSFDHMSSASCPYGNCTKTSYVTRYQCSITGGTDAIVGYVQMYKNIDSGYKLIASASSMTITAYSWNTGATTSTINVTGNGTYYCDVTAKEATGAFHTTRISYTVTDYMNLFNVSVPGVIVIEDNTVIFAIQYTPTSYSKGEIVISPQKVTITKVDGETVTPYDLPVSGTAVKFTGGTTQTKTYTGAVQIPTQAGVYEGTLIFSIDSGNN